MTATARRTPSEAGRPGSATERAGNASGTPARVARDDGGARVGRLARLALLAASVATHGGFAVAAPGESNLTDQQVASSEGFLSAHPDLRWRLAGADARRRGQPATAAGYFRRAARYADKPSQAMYAEMLWTGEGVEQDRPLALAWMDLAAERGYPHFIAHRERYWHALNSAEREEAIARGQAVYQEFGDEVAKPRLERRLERGRREVTGSRLGYLGNFLGNMKIELADGITVGGDDYYQERYWEPAAYWAWQDRTWGRPATGKATVGELEVDRDPSKPLPR